MYLFRNKAISQIRVFFMLILLKTEETKSIKVYTIIQNEKIIHILKTF